MPIRRQSVQSATSAAHQSKIGRPRTWSGPSSNPTQSKNLVNLVVRCLLTDQAILSVSCFGTLSESTFRSLIPLPCHPRRSITFDGLWLAIFRHVLSRTCLFITHLNGQSTSNRSFFSTSLSICAGVGIAWNRTGCSRPSSDRLDMTCTRWGEEYYPG